MIETFQNSFRLQEDFAVGKPQHPYSWALEIPRAQPVLGHSFLSTVLFDRQLHSGTIEVEYVVTHRMLATEFYACELAAS